MEWVDGKLVPIGSSKKRTFSTAEKQDIYAKLLGYAQQHMLKPGWAYFKCQEYCGSAPRDTKTIAAKRPSPELEKWVRHVNIKWAKRRNVA